MSIGDIPNMMRIAAPEPVAWLAYRNGYPGLFFEEPDDELYSGIAPLYFAPPSERVAMLCGHPAEMLLKSAETGDPLYCEYCDCISRRNDAETRERELSERVALLEGLLREWLDGEYDGQDYLRRVRLALHQGAPVAALGGSAGE